MITKGTILIATNGCIMNYLDYPNALIINKEYKVNDVWDNLFSISSEVDEEHWFSMEDTSADYLGKYFTIKDNKN